MVGSDAIREALTPALMGEAMDPARGLGPNAMTVMGLPGGDARASRREDRHPLFATVIPSPPRTWE